MWIARPHNCWMFLVEKTSSVLTLSDPEPLGNIICNRLLGIYEEMCVEESAPPSALPSSRHSIVQALGNLLATSASSKVRALSSESRCYLQ